MRIRRVAILIDGSFFLKRLKRWPEINRDDPDSVADAAKRLCQTHVRTLIGETGEIAQSRWLDHVYRLFFYDAEPFSGNPHHPLRNSQVNFEKSPEARFRRDLFERIRRERKFALRLGTLKNEGYWTPHERHLKGLLKIWHHVERLDDLVCGAIKPNPEQDRALLGALAHWKNLSADDIFYPLRQKGVDMKIGLDIASMTLKRQADTIILVTGDSDFIPAAKVARREGVEFLLDPMWQSVEGELMEHIDGIASGFDRPSN